MISDSAQSLQFIIDDKDNGRRATNSGAIFEAATPLTNDLRRVMLELMSKQGMRRLQKQHMRQWTETDAMSGGAASGHGAGVGAASCACAVTYADIIFTAVSMVMRAITVVLNVDLAVTYYRRGQEDYFAWTVVCTVVPMCVTTLIYARWCHKDDKFGRGVRQTIQLVLVILLSSFCLRYWNSLVYSIKCKHAQLRGERDKQVRYYQLTAREDSDLAFIRLFECFMETAPQKILLFSIILMQEQKISTTQVYAIASYFLSMTWALGSYNRCLRAAQADKLKLDFKDMVPQLLWHFCITLSRTLCITFVVVLYPIWSVVACACHCFILGFLTFIVERPPFATKPFYNFLFCQAMGVVYLFTYIPVKDAPTRNKYTLYYILCSSENLTCAGLFMSFAPAHLMQSALLFYGICTLAITFYYVGIIFMCIYYLHYHPNVTARRAIFYNN